MQLTGIILAGGKSTRMGTDKALLNINGGTLLLRAVKICHLVCDQILISSNSVKHEIEGIQRVADEFPDCGPMGGIYSCLKHSDNDWNFVLSIDSTFVEPDFVSFLISQTNDFEAVVPVHNNGKEPLIALFHRKILPLLKLQLISGNYKMHFLIEKMNTCFVDSNHWIEKYPKLFQNLNYPHDRISIS